MNKPEIANNQVHLSAGAIMHPDSLMQLPLTQGLKRKSPEVLYLSKKKIIIFKHQSLFPQDSLIQELPHIPPNVSRVALKQLEK